MGSRGSALSGTERTVALGLDAGYRMTIVVRRLFRTLFLLVGVLGLVPGANGALEQLVERIAHGHAAHSVAGEHDALAAEHGCTPLQHHCPCHESQSIALASFSQSPAAEQWLTLMLEPDPVRYAAVGRTPSSNDTQRAVGANAPPTPPPNA